MITNEEKKRYLSKSNKVLKKIKSSIKKHRDNDNIAGPFYKDGCIIYCSKNRLEEVKSKFKLDEQ
tara:strand:+ start:16314 stop:16508 length:195 start_codon:yes stop_codon:yes gene_type:complete